MDNEKQIIKINAKNLQKKPFRNQKADWRSINNENTSIRFKG